MPEAALTWIRRRKGSPDMAWARPSPARAVGALECGLCAGGCGLGPEGSSCARRKISVRSGVGVDPSADDIRRFPASGEAQDTCRTIQDGFEQAAAVVRSLQAALKLDDEPPADEVADFRRRFAEVATLGSQLVDHVGGTWENTAQAYLQSWWARYGRNLDSDRLRALARCGLLDEDVAGYLIEIAEHGVPLRSDCAIPTMC